MPSRSQHWVGGSTRAHRRSRALVLERAGGLCQLQLPDVCTRRATDAHHTLGRGVTGDDPAHMIATCNPCNLKAGDPTRFDPEPRINDEWWLTPDHDHEPDHERMS